MIIRDDLEITLLDPPYHNKGVVGQGGMHTGAISSGICVVHIPTGTKATCELFRSQHKNKDWCVEKIEELLEKIGL